MRNIMKYAMVSLMTIGLLSGCGGSSNKTNETTVVEASETIAAENFDTETGQVTQETTVVVTEEENSDEEVAEVTIPSETSFVTEAGEPVTEAPVLEVKKETTSTEVTTELTFTVGDEKVAPTEPVTVKIPAPAGAKPGDEVTIEVPDDVSAAKGDEVAKKLIVVIVDENGLVGFVVIPEAFRGKTVVLIIKLPDSSTN